MSVIPPSHSQPSDPKTFEELVKPLVDTPQRKLKRGGRPGRNGASVRAIVGRNTLPAAEIVRSLQQQSGMSEAAAARALQRAVEAKQIVSTAPVSFGPGRVYLYWNLENYDKELRLKALMKHMAGRPAMQSLIEALVYFKGEMPKQFALRCTSAPVSRIPKHTSFDQITKELLQLDLIRNAPDKLYGFQLVLEPNLRKSLISQGISRFSWPIRLRAEGLSLEIAAQWLQVTSLVAWKTVKVRNSVDGTPVIFNNYAFDLVAPCYIAPVARTSPEGKRTPGFLLADLTVGRCDPWMAHNFLRKLTEIRSRSKPPTIIGCCFAGSFSPEAMNILRGGGVIVVPLERIGSGNLVAIVRAMAATYALSVMSPNRIDMQKTIKALTQLANNRDGNLAGRLFEFMMARSATLDNLTVFNVGKTIKFKDSDGKQQQVEIDVIAHDGHLNNWTVISAKGYNAFQPVRLHEVEEWFGNRISHVQKHLDEQHKGNKQFNFIFATSSYFEREALEYMEKRKSKFTGKVKIDWVDSKKLREMWSENGRDLIESLDRFFGKPADSFFSLERGIVTDREAQAPELGISLPPRPTQTDVVHLPSDEDIQNIRDSILADDPFREVDGVVRDLVQLPEKNSHPMPQ
jgi:hypothetical protein